jgi:predicted P-loop ATPase
VSARDAAAALIQQGLYPIPLRPKSKACRDAKWLEKVYSPEDFSDEDNVGLLLVGAADRRSVKVAAVDFDAAELSAEVVDAFFPRTAGWGRETKAVSQLLYRVPFDKSVKYEDQAAKDKGGDKATLVEVRVDHQSMIPPSVHPNGERLTWRPGVDVQALHIAEIQADELTRLVRLAATTAMVVRNYPPAGARHEWGLAMAGFLRHLGLPESEAGKVLGLAADRAGDLKKADRLQELATTYAAAEDARLKGSGALIEEMGADRGQPFVKTLRRIWNTVEGDLIRDDRGNVVSTSQENVRLALERLGVTLAHDIFAGEKTLTRNGQTARLEDDLVTKLWLEVDRQFAFKPGFDFFTRVLVDVATDNPYHPVRDYLSGLTWDEQARIDRWLVEYGGAADTELTRVVGAMVLIAAVRRVRQPGVKFDEMLVLESAQGKDKSNALRALCPRLEWFADSVPLDQDAKRMIEATRSIWIAEVSDLAGMSSAKVDHLKATLSRSIDGPTRLAYARLPVTVPRQFIVVGTTNDTKYLSDPTGGRRFWPVRVQRFDLDAIRRDRDQLWAEAAAREAQGAAIRLPEHLWGAAAVQQERRREEDPWEDVLEPRYTPRPERVQLEDPWTALDIPVAGRTPQAQQRLTKIMARLGYVKKNARLKDDPKRQAKQWVRGDAMEQVRLTE